MSWRFLFSVLENLIVRSRFQAFQGEERQETQREKDRRHPAGPELYQGWGWNCLTPEEPWRSLVGHSSSLRAGYTRRSGAGRRGADTVLPLPMAQVFPPKLFIRSTPGTDVTASGSLLSLLAGGWGEGVRWQQAKVRCTYFCLSPFKSTLWED